MYLLVFMISLDYSVIQRDIRPTKNTNTGDSIELEKQIRIQNEQYFEIYDYVAKNLTKAEQIRILSANGQALPNSNAQVSENGTLSN